MAKLAVIKEGPNGVGIATSDLVAADVNGDEFENDGNTRPIIQNDSGAPITVTFVGQRPAIHPDDPLINRTLVVAGMGTLAIGRKLDTRYFNTTGLFNAGRVQMTYSSVTNVLVGAIQMEA